jgi:hypothetical protein
MTTLGITPENNRFAIPNQSYMGIYEKDVGIATEGGTSSFVQY